MRSLFLTSLLVFLLPQLTTQLYAQSNSSGPNSPVVVAKVISADKDGVIVLQGGQYERHLKFTRTSKIAYVGFKGLGMKNVKSPQEGFGVKAKVNPDGDIVKSIKFTPALPEENRPIADKYSMSIQTLFDKTDHNGNGELDYLEYSVSIVRSPKHGPDHFQANDKNGDDILDLKEFTRIMSNVEWWRLSRKAPEAWMKESDKNGDGEISRQEFNHIGSGSHVDSHFKRADKNKSQSLDFKELTGYLFSRSGRTADGGDAPDKKKVKDKKGKNNQAPEVAADEKRKKNKKEKKKKI